ncbi:non-ribosomal peptide synthetase [Gordonia sp. DT219]|uniref:non-ribosomal peptide synthetase n=1 Tax=Gordonia sp. DT219 TaxID=3416658 RepID=UPI003CF3ACC7
MSSTRRALRLAQILRPETTHVIAFSILLTGPLDVDRLRDTVDSVLDHLGWRGTYLLSHHSSSGGARTDESTFRTDQADSTRGVAIEVVDLRDAADPAGESRKRTDAFVDDPDGADLERPLWRSQLHRLGPDRHRLIVRVHHVLTDGAGGLRVVSHVGAVYAGSALVDDFSAGSDDDIDRAEADYRTSPRHRADAEFWSEILATHQPSTLSGHRGPPTSRIDRLTVALPAVRQPSTGEVVAAFAGLCARLLDTADVGLSLPVAARTTALRRRATAPLSNVIPLTLPGIGDADAATALDQIGTAVVRALRHQLYPREEMLRSQAGMTGFGPVVNLLPPFTPPPDTGVDWTVEVLRTGPVGDVSMTLQQADADGHRSVTWEVPADTMSAAELHTFAARFNQYLAAFIDEIDGGPAIPDTALFVDDEWQRSRVRSGPHPPPFTPTAALLDGLLADDPSAPAVIDGEITLTRAQLVARADRGARLLAEAGVTPGDRVAVCLDRSASSVVAFWAVIRAGAVWVPAQDSFLPESRTRDILGRTAIAVGLASTPHPPIPSIRWIDLDSESATHPAHDGEFRCPGADRGPDDTAYILFTSGSTGVPKGVVVPHRGLPALVADIRMKYTLNTESRMLHASSLTFDNSIVEMLAAAATGAALVVCPAAVRGGEAMARLMRRHAVSHAIVTPSVLETLPVDLADQLTQVIVGGEPIGTALIDRWADRVILRNAYGPTETRCSINISPRLRPDDTVTVGPPMTGVTETILDRHGRPAPPGAVGTLYCSGPAVGDGYLDAPELTAEAFTPSTFSSDPVMYRTGDLATWTPSGEIMILGRRDGQVKVRGLRIELGEIDAAIARTALVRRSATLLRESPTGRKALVSFVVPVAEPDSSPAEPAAALGQQLRSALTAELPSYMVPAHLTVVADLPHTVNGKLDRAALDALAIPEQRDARGPRGCHEVALARAVRTAVGAESVDPEQGFLEQGGDSLTALQVVYLLAAEGYPELSVDQLLLADNLAEVAARMADRPAETGTVRPPPEPVPARDALHPAQQTVSRDPADPCAQTIRAAFEPRPDSPIGVDAVRGVVALLLERHPMLRTVFPDGPGGRVDAVTREAARCSVVDVRHISGPIDHESLDEASRDMAAHLDVRSDPPIAVTLLITDRDVVKAVIVVAHHIAVDGHSLGLLGAEVATLLRGGRLEPPRSAPAHGTGTRLGSDDEQFWLSTLSAEPQSSWQIGGVSPADLAPASAVRRSATIDRNLGKRFHADAVRRRLTPFEAFETAVAETLAARTGNRTVLSATPVSGRGPDTRNMVGNFVFSGIVPLTAGDGDVEFAARSRRCLRAATVPMETILDLVGRPAVAGRLFPVPLLISWTPTPPEMGEFGTAHGFRPTHSRWLLQIEGNPAPSGELHLVVTTTTDGLGVHTADALLADLVERIGSSGQAG